MQGKEVQLQQHISAFLHDECVKLLKKVLAGHCTNYPIFFNLPTNTQQYIQQNRGGGVIINTLHFKGLFFCFVYFFVFFFPQLLNCCERRKSNLTWICLYKIKWSYTYAQCMLVLIFYILIRRKGRSVLTTFYM